MKEYKKLLSNFLFLKFFLSINLMTLSQSFVNISIIWLVYEEIKDPLLVVFFGMLMQIPPLLFGTVISRILDRLSIQKAISGLLWLRATIFFSIFILPFQTVIGLYVVAFLLCINSLISPLLSAGTNVLISEIVDKNNLVAANSLLTVFFDISYIFSSIAVTILAYINNNRLAFLIAGFLLLVAAFMMMNIHLDDSMSNDDRNKSKAQDSWLISLKYIIKNKNILVFMLLTTVWNMFTWGTFSTLLPIYVENNLQNNAVAYGLLNSMQSVGIIIASLVIGTNIIQKISIESIICGGIILHCIFLIGFNFSYSMEWSIFLLLLSGVFSAPVIIYKSTYFQKEIPRHIRGQVFSFILIVSSFSYPFGSGIVAFLLNFLGTKNFSNVSSLVLGCLILMSMVSWKMLIENRE